MKGNPICANAEASYNSSRVRYRLNDIALNIYDPEATLKDAAN